jgi:hypothetical protein
LKFFGLRRTQTRHGGPFDDRRHTLSVRKVHDARGAMSDLEYKGWQIELRSSRAPDAEGWRAYVTVSASQGGSSRTVPLSYKDARLFPSKEAADEAGIRIAKVWIDHPAQAAYYGGNTGIDQRIRA